MRRIFLSNIAGIVMLLGCIFIGGAGTIAEAQAPDAIKIGCTLPLTGRFAANGIEVKDGYEIAVQHINEDGDTGQGIWKEDPGQVDHVR